MAQGKELRVALRNTVKAEFSGEWADYNRDKGKLAAERMLYDREARRAIKACYRTYRVKDGSAHVEADRNGEPYRAYDGADGAKMIVDIRARQQAYHARIKETLRQRRDDIHTRQCARVEELARPAFKHLRAERDAAYDKVKASHRGEKEKLNRDQRAGTRRPDLLPGPTPQPRATDLVSTMARIGRHIRRAEWTVTRDAAFRGSAVEIGGAPRPVWQVAPEHRRVAMEQLAAQYAVALPIPSGEHGPEQKRGPTRMDRSPAPAELEADVARAVAPGSQRDGNSGAKPTGAYPLAAGEVGSKRRPYSKNWSAEQLRNATDRIGRNDGVTLPVGARRDVEHPRKIARVDNPAAPAAPPSAKQPVLAPSRRWTDASLAQSKVAEDERAAKTRADHDRRAARAEVTGQQPVREISDRVATTSVKERKDAALDQEARRWRVEGWLAKRAADRARSGSGRDR